MSGWCTIESDPGVFSELLSSIGVQDVYCEEIWSLEDKEVVNRLRPIYGLIFLFKYKSGEKKEDLSCNAPHVYFAKQVVNNACGTQAIINVLLNCIDQVDIGPELKTFLEFTGEMDPETRGITIENFDSIRDTHNSFARHSNFTFEDKVATEDDDAFHFIGYVPKDGVVYELDGLQNGPIEVGTYTDDWLPTANAAIQKRMATYQDELRFTLLALCKDPTRELKAQHAELVAKGDASSDFLKQEIEVLEARRMKWKVENARRRHNYIPFLVALLRILSEKGALKGAVEKAIEKTAQEKAKKISAKKAKKAEESK